MRYSFCKTLDNRKLSRTTWFPGGSCSLFQNVNANNRMYVYTLPPSNRLLHSYFPCSESSVLMKQSFWCLTTDHIPDMKSAWSGGKKMNGVGERHQFMSQLLLALGNPWRSCLIKIYFFTNDNDYNLYLLNIYYLPSCSSTLCILIIWIPRTILLASSYKSRDVKWLHKLM